MMNRVERRIASAAWVVALLLGCSRPSAGPGTYEGVAVAVFEVSGFTRGDGCGSEPHWWLTFAPGSNVEDAMRRAGLTDEASRHSYRLKASGRLSPVGRYGHLGAFERELVVDHVIEVGPARGCPAL